MKTSPRLRNFLLAAGSCLLAVSSAHAQATWDGDTSNNWGTAANWSGAVPGTASNIASGASLDLNATPISRPPVRPNGSFRGLPQKANS